MEKNHLECNVQINPNKINHICLSIHLTSLKFTSPGISIGKAAKDSITSDADIATVFLSTATNPKS
jgi:hypothetical protein